MLSDAVGEWLQWLQVKVIKLKNIICEKKYNRYKDLFISYMLYVDSQLPVE